MIDTVRFIHTADLHLDSPLRSLAARNPELGRLLHDTSRKLLQRIIDTALEEEVDALLIAGDLFDGKQGDVHTAMVLQRELRRLQEQDIPVFIIWGNHDAETRFLDNKILDLPENVHTFDGRGGRRFFANDRAVVHGVSFTKRKTPESLLGKFGKPDSHCFNIGMLHTSLTGADGHNDYAPCTVKELIDKDYDYWALGHIHKRQIHHEQPAVVMPGNPLGRHVNENGERSISLVALEQGKKPDIRSINLAPVRFEQLAVSIDGIDDKNAAFEQIVSMLNQCRNSIDADILITRIQLEGTSTLATSYQRDREQLLLALQTEIEHRDDLWIDSISTGGLQLVDNQENNAADTYSIAAELTDLVADDLLNDISLENAVAEDLALLVKALPPDLNGLFGETPEQEREYIRQTLLPDGAKWIQRQMAGHASSEKHSDEQSDS